MGLVIVGGARIALIGVLALSLVEKLSRLADGTHRLHPVIVAHATLGRHSEKWMLAAALADASCIVLLSSYPTMGAAVSIVILFTYSGFGLGAFSESRETCSCLGVRVLEARSRLGFLSRNLALVVYACVVVAAGHRLAAFAHVPNGWTIVSGLLLIIPLGLAAHIGGRPTINGEPESGPRRSIGFEPVPTSDDRGGGEWASMRFSNGGR